MPRSTRIIVAIACASHLSVHALMLVLPSILLVLQTEFHTGLDTLGLIVAAGAFMFGLGAIPTGALENRIGGRRLLLACQLGTAAAAVLIVFSPSLPMLTVGVIVLGLFASLYHPAGLTLLSRRVPNLSQALGLHGVAGSLGLALGPVLAATFTDWLSWRAAYAVLAMVNLGLAAATGLLIPARSPGEPEPDAANTAVTNRPALVTYFAVMALLGLSFAGFTTFMPAHFSLHTTGLTSGLSTTVRGGLFTAIVFVGGTVGQLAGGHIGGRYSRAGSLLLILAVNVPLLLLIGVARELALVVVAVIFGMVHFALQPLGNALIANFTHSHSRGLGYGISFFLSFGVGSLGAALGGLVAERYGVQFVFTLMGLILVPAVALAWRLRRLTGPAR